MSDQDQKNHRLNGRGKSEHERLRTMLLEDLDSAEEADALLSTAHRLRRWAAPEVSRASTDRLIETLTPTLPIPESRADRFKRRFADSWPLLLLRAQMRVVQRDIWLASALVMVI